MRVVWVLLGCLMILLLTGCKGQASGEVKMPDDGDVVPRAYIIVATTDADYHLNEVRLAAMSNRAGRSLRMVRAISVGQYLLYAEGPLSESELHILLHRIQQSPEVAAVQLDERARHQAGEQ